MKLQCNYIVVWDTDDNDATVWSSLHMCHRWQWRAPPPLSPVQVLLVQSPLKGRLLWLGWRGYNAEQVVCRHAGGPGRAKSLVLCWPATDRSATIHCSVRNGSMAGKPRRRRRPDLASANPGPTISYNLISGPIIPLKPYYFILIFLLFHLFNLHNLDYYVLLFQNLNLDYYFSYFNSIISIIL